MSLSGGEEEQYSAANRAQLIRLVLLPLSLLTLPFPFLPLPTGLAWTALEKTCVFYSLIGQLAAQ